MKKRVSVGTAPNLSLQRTRLPATHYPSALFAPLNSSLGSLDFPLLLGMHNPALDMTSSEDLGVSIEALPYLLYIPRSLQALFPRKAGGRCMKEYGEQMYYDDRLFLLYLCLGTVYFDGDVVTTTIHHENPPPEAEWCLVTYRNCADYPAVSVFHFQNREDAVTYMQMIEPTTPLISHKGQSVMPPLSYDEYTRWKMDEHLEDYDYRKCYRPGGTNPKEMFLQTRDQYVASAKRMRDLLACRPN